MDPLKVFPPEIVHQIWRCLKPVDLLAARAVARHWLASISDCPGAWVTDFSHDWTEFLSVKMTVHGWTSKKVRRETVENVKECVFTEFAYYLLYGNGNLEMFHPSGETVRIFHRPVSDLHRGDRCLLIGVSERSKSLENCSIRHRTIITDFVLNYIDDMYDVEIVASSSNGYLYTVSTPYSNSLYQNAEYFFSVGSEIPGHLKIPCTADDHIQFLPSCAVLVQGLTVKTVQLFDAKTESFTHLKSSTSSPRWIPLVEILPGPEDYFSIIVEQRDFNGVSVYNRDRLLFEDSYPSPFKCAFTEDYFVLSLRKTATAFKLSDFTQHYNLSLPVHFEIKSITCESWSLLKNTLAVFKAISRGSPDPEQWMVYRLSEADTTFEPKLQQLATNAAVGMLMIGFLAISEFEICPGYAFKVQANLLSRGGNERFVSLIHFDL